jgi:hypothetical protein
MELPQDLSNLEEIELFSLKPGYYLLSIPIGQPAGQDQTAAPKTAKSGSAKPGDDQISDAESAVLAKLLSIRFEQRIPEHVNGILDKGELPVLAELERKGLVNVFKSAKYKEGVYNISDRAYLLAQKGKQPVFQPREAAPMQSNDLSNILKRQGFIVINDKNQARMLSESLSQEMKNGAVAGVKGFDNKFYIVTRTYLNQAQVAITKALTEDLDAPSVAAAVKLDPDGCLAVLRIMSEAGEILEKKRGVFAPV